MDNPVNAVPLIEKVEQFVSSRGQFLMSLDTRGPVPLSPQYETRHSSGKPVPGH